MIGWLYALFLVSVTGFIIIKGQLEERIAIGALAFGSISTFLIYLSADRSFLHLRLPLLISESFVLLVLITLAYRSSRFWPLPVASMQIASYLALLTPLFAQTPVSYALGVAQGLWAYPQLLMLVIAVVRAERRSRTEGNQGNSLPPF